MSFSTSNISPGYLLALTGPSGVGKTTISQRLVTAAADHVRKPPIITTRAPKKHDGDEYRYVTMQEFLGLKRDGRLAAEAELLPKNEKRWYGYRIGDLDAVWREGKIPVVITEMYLLQGFVNRYGRGAILSCGLLPPGGSRNAMLSVIEHRLRLRNRDTGKSIRGRIQNAERDLAFFSERADLFDYLLVNDDVGSIVSVLEKEIRSIIGKNR
uniref:Guanylate kinase n=1 Tax=Candidatus Kentrum sp. FW TaxID=2126338 RepID=A0A450SFP0_9GAMM|nr:MAG: guanylate kinase [Candidatus Kentron sp. FW]VFJ51704.1 MAG: guanylate kinase [Candidatus Kentron sp. FW]